MKISMDPRVKIIVSMAVFGTIGVFTRNIQVTSGELALYRAVLAAALISIYLAVTKQHIDFKAIKREIPLLLLSGVAMGINWILLFQAYRYTTISAATLSYYFAPVIVTAVCPFLFKEKMTAKQMICFVMSTVGIIMITGISDLGQGSSDFLGIMFGLGAAVFYATVILLNKFIKGVSGIHRTLLQFIAAIITLTPYVAVTSGVTLNKMTLVGWVCLLVVGLIHTGITYCLYFSSIEALPGQKAAILSYIDPLVAVVISVFVLGEKMTVMQAAGGVLILGFTLWNEITPSKSKQ